ncbi:MAG: beta/gamma crystallin-related protein [Promethearchaeota archaeon]
MKNKSKKKILLFVLVIIFVLSAVSIQNLSDDKLKNEGNVEIRDKTNPKKIEIAENGLYSSNGDIIIYQDQNYGGASQILTVGKYDVCELSIGDNKLSSLKVPEGFNVTLYECPGFSGNTMSLTSDTPNIGAFDDITSSIIVFYRNSPIIYQDQNYGGNSQILTVGKYDVCDLTIGDNKLSSLKVPEGFNVTLYECPGFSGNTMSLTSDTPNVGAFNDMASSIIVEFYTISPPPPPPPPPAKASSGDDDNDEDNYDEGIEFLSLILVIVGSTLAIGVAGVYIYFVRKKQLKLKREK